MVSFGRLSQGDIVRYRHHWGVVFYFERVEYSRFMSKNEFSMLRNLPASPRLASSRVESHCKKTFIKPSIWLGVSIFSAYFYGSSSRFETSRFRAEP